MVKTEIKWRFYFFLKKECLNGLERFCTSCAIGYCEKAIRFCENTECEDCLVAIEGLEHRTRYEKEVEHVPCADNLIFELANGRTLD